LIRHLIPRIRSIPIRARCRYGSKFKDRDGKLVAGAFAEFDSKSFDFKNRRGRRETEIRGSRGRKEFICRQHNSAAITALKKKKTGRK